MTIRKMWLIILITMAVVAVVVNAVILSLLTDRYFRDYLTENYKTNVDEITQYSKGVLLQEDFSLAQASMELETRLDDPITQIKLYDTNGRLVVEVGSEEHMMMGSRMMGRFSGQYDAADSETDSVEIYNDGKLIGQLNITRYSSVENSASTRMFTSSLFYNSLYSIAIVLVIAVVVGVVISRRMSRALTGTAKMAQNIELGTQTQTQQTGIREINTIQRSLESLDSKLRLKNKSRKVLIDELVHQTRTPLTVLKTHLEGFSDGVLELNPEEIKVCESQVDNITAIISNMSSIIDAGEDTEKPKPENFEIAALLRQLTNGLKAQFEKKDITLELSLHERQELFTDKHKLSQAVYNILTNAYKYTDSGGRVKVGCSSSAGSISITIEDTGEGINEAEIDRIFDAYYRSGHGQDIKGDGLGLYIARENLEKINGGISVESSKGKGSRFTIMLPARYEEKEDA